MGIKEWCHVASIRPIILYDTTRHDCHVSVMSRPATLSCQTRLHPVIRVTCANRVTEQYIEKYAVTYAPHMPPCNIGRSFKILLAVLGLFPYN